VIVINLHGNHGKIVNDLKHEKNWFKWLNIIQFFGFCVVRRWLITHSANFLHCSLSPPAGMRTSRRPRMGSLRESSFTHRVSKSSLNVKI
jgi:hypothetical protein